MPRLPSLADPQYAHGRCLIESDKAAARLRRQGKTPMLVAVYGLGYPGREHWAVYLPDDPDEPISGRVLDLTARQFRADAPSPWEGDVDDWLDDACEWLADGLRYAFYPSTGNLGSDTASPAFCDTWIRDEIVPGPMTYPWERAS